MINRENEENCEEFERKSNHNLIKNIVLIGTPGCGKTTIGKIISEKLGIEFCDVDEYIEKREQRTINEIFKGGEAAFRKIETEVIKEVSRKVSTIISTGGGAVKNPENMECFNKNSIIIFVNRPVDNIAKDIDMVSRPLLKDGVSKLYALYNERLPLYKKYCNYEVLNDGIIEDTVNKIMDIIKK